MKKLNKMIQPVSRLICAVSGFVLLALGATDIQNDEVAKGSALIAPSIPLIGFVVGKKTPKGSNEGGDNNGD
jgi:hypothetical protein